MENHYEIREGGVIYNLGKVHGKQIVYNFSEILNYLQVKGKMMFGDHFRIHEEDREILLKLSNYFVRDVESCKKFEIDLKKGILLSGPVGCGKTSLMRLLKFIIPFQRSYEVISTRNIVFGFNHVGFKTVEDYGSSGYFCFDDLGVEHRGRYFGKDCAVMGEILLSRHELFQRYKVKTHITTNLSATELEERYGQRVRSRMRELFNLLAFDANAKDKRK